MSMNREWYDKANEYWESIEETRYLEREEIEEIYPRFLTFLADTMNGMQPQESLAWEDLNVFFGWNTDTFDWEEFREWYDSL